MQQKIIILLIDKIYSKETIINVVVNEIWRNHYSVIYEFNLRNADEIVK